MQFYNILVNLRFYSIEFLFKVFPHFVLNSDWVFIDFGLKFNHGKFSAELHALELISISSWSFIFFLYGFPVFLFVSQHSQNFIGVLTLLDELSFDLSFLFNQFILFLLSKNGILLCLINVLQGFVNVFCIVMGTLLKISNSLSVVIIYFALFIFHN